MGSHPLNLLIRFILEMSALISVGLWGWRLFESWPKYLLAIGLPIIMATIWGVFAVPDDPSRSGSAPVPVPGLVRLLIELGFFGVATLALYGIGYNKLSIALLLIVILHYVVSYDRIQWLLSQ